jgi:hypothetical protein
MAEAKPHRVSQSSRPAPAPLVVAMDFPAERVFCASL